MLGRVIPGAWFGFVLVVQVMHLQSEVAAAGGRSASTVALLDIANTCLLLAYYGLLVGLYVVRLPHFDGDRRPHIAAASFAGTFLVTAVPFLPAAPRRDWLLLPADVATLAGILYALWSLLYLRRSFSILPQARRLVTGGPYALSRNPLYLGELVASWSVFLPTIAWAGLPAPGTPPLPAALAPADRLPPSAHRPAGHLMTARRRRADRRMPPVSLRDFGMTIGSGRRVQSVITQHLDSRGPSGPWL
jgi:hypothetical protein